MLSGFASSLLRAIKRPHPPPTSPVTNFQHLLRTVQDPLDLLISSLYDTLHLLLRLLNIIWSHRSCHLHRSQFLLVAPSCLSDLKVCLIRRL